MSFSLPFGRCAVRAACAIAVLVGSQAHAAVLTQTASFNFSHTGSVSSGTVSLAATYTNTETASPSALSFNRFDSSLGRLTQVDITVTTSTASFAIHPTGALSLVSTASATRSLTYTVTAGASNGGDGNTVVTSGTALVNGLGLGTTEIGGAALAKTTAFTTAADINNFSGSGTVSVALTATNTLSVTTLLSLFNGAGMAGSGTYAGNVSVTYTYTPWSLSGFVYNDADHNSFRSAGEGGTGLTLYAKLLSEASPSGPALQAVAVDSATGLFTLPVARGVYRIVIDDNATLSDVTPLSVPAGWTATQAATLIRTGISVNSDLGGQDFGLIYAVTACGRLFKDDGAGSGTANDGVLNGAESGSGAQLMKLLDAGNTALDTATAASDGSYCLYIPSTTANAAALRIQRIRDGGLLATGASLGNSAGSYARASDALSFNFVTARSYTGLNFGAVPLPTLSGNGQQGGTPGAVLWFAHRFTAGSSGQAAFSLTQTAPPELSALQATVYLDANANGRIDSGEQPLAGALAVTAGSTVALLIKVVIPAGAPAQARAQVNLRADMSFANASPALAYALTATDVADVLAATAAALQLTKSVDKTSVAPGGTLLYTLVFTNTGATPLTQLIVNDATPAFTTFVSAAAVSIPSTLGTMNVTTPSAGGVGALRWSFTGQLLPTASGSVQFTVSVAP